jgi:hypothetical protein
VVGSSSSTFRVTLRFVRIVVIGGTNFVGPAVVEELLVAEHEPIVLHRGNSESADLPEAHHVHCDRRDIDSLKRALDELSPDAVVDTCSHARRDAEALAVSLPKNTRAVVLSSMDVYRAFGALDRGTSSDPLPLYEDWPLREERYLRRGKAVSAPGFDPDPDSYESSRSNRSHSPSAPRSCAYRWCTGPVTTDAVKNSS